MHDRETSAVRPAPSAIATVERLRITYELATSGEEDPFDKARAVALEQTVELPPGTFPPDLHYRVVGRLEGIERHDKRRWRAVISYGEEVVGSELPQVLNVLFGNVSLMRGVKIVGVDWPEPLLAALGGPAFGLPGLREMLPGAGGRALLCAVLKPVGLSSRELADLAYRFALAGVDLVKDDHGLADQASAPFAERVRRCAEAVARGRRDGGGHTLYLPNLGGPVHRLPERLALLAELGLSGGMLLPFIGGFDTLCHLAHGSGLLLLAHPTFSGALFQPDHGISAEIVYGDLLRVAGADIVNFPHAGGRFPFSEAECVNVMHRLRRPLRQVRPAFPMVGGGVEADSVPYWLSRYGTDTVFLVGGSLYAGGDVEGNSRRLMAALAAASRGQPSA